MKVLGVIPARYASTRFPGKPLALIAGRPLLQWVIEACQKSQKLTQFLVATDDQRIANLARDLGVAYEMTDSNLPTGSDRVWQAGQRHEADVILSIQGDEPLLEGWVLDQLIAPFAQDGGLQMATLGRELSHDDLSSLNTVKIVQNCRGEALYFSRFAIPYSRHLVEPGQKLEGALKHIGIYAYRRDFLQTYCAQPVVEIEARESLEQLRALYLGARIKVVKVDHESWGVDVPEDVAKVEKILRSRMA